jgi:hypothetical protein
MMDEKFEIWAMDYMSGNLSEKEAKGFEAFLDERMEYREKYDELLKAWELLQTMQTPEPSEKMDETFFGMLSSEMEREQGKAPKQNIVSMLSGIFRPQWVIGIFLLLFGLGVGYFLRPDVETIPTQTIAANNETEEVRQKLVLTLLDQPSANQRLQGVSEANKFENADDIVIRALLKTLNSDPNVNVRLAAIESLTNYVDKPEVRQGLVQSIPNQESPILQITLANLMVALQEKASIEPFKQLLKQKQLDTTVKKRIERSIESII